MIKKNFEDLTKEELLELNEDDIQWYIKVEMAKDGVKILQMPIEPTYQPLPETDKKLYEVSGITFSTLEAAEKVRDALNTVADQLARSNYNYGLGYNYKYFEKTDKDDFVINTQSLYSKEVYDSISGVLKDNEKVRNVYKNAKEEYEKETEKAESIVDVIRGKIEAAHREKMELENYTDRIVEYFELAQGNADVAWSFFLKAYPVIDEVVEQVKATEKYKQLTEQNNEKQSA